MTSLAVDASLFGQDGNTFDDPSYKIVNHALDKLMLEKPRLQKLSDYYDGKQDIQKRIFNNDRTTKNIKVTVNHAKYITDMNVGFMTGNPIKYTAAKGKNIDAVLDEMDTMDLQKHDTELEKDCSVMGYGYEILYLKELPEPINGQRVQTKIECIDPRAVVMVTDDTVEHEPLFAIYAQQKFDLDGVQNGWLITVYTKTTIIEYRTLEGYRIDESTRKTIRPHYFGDVPIVEYRNNEERQGDFEQEVSLIDAYNTIQSDRVSDKEAFVDALLIFYGFGINEDDQADLKHGFINNAPSKSDGASAEWLVKTFDEGQVELLKKSLEDDIHKTSYVPNMNDSNFMGNVSGEAMKYKLFGLLNLLATKTRYFTEGLRKRLKLIQNILAVRGQAADVSGCGIKITPNIPVNLSEAVSNVVAADGHIPREIAYSWLPDIDDPKEVDEMMQEQTAQSIKAQQQAMLEGNPDYMEGQGKQDQGRKDKEVPDDKTDKQAKRGSNSANS
ncbi:phage portal protein [Lactobacillus nasalidis]|uniref:Phage portal protein n=1 Tax=Lactobacillus nasalidis TaxID=2797258 RepID=A0ABQ3W4L7_9LACO|nr:phage portal protein [Lactobacillus nasalidis]GHV97886.1 phage portal protein [Lactobacillus nasalidis]GHW00116.1 phage portal protein [Lactobacillus nasalidis]GHW01475.1 phage portal protein [Lactobacillus nasalidis]